MATAECAQAPSDFVTSSNILVRALSASRGKPDSGGENFCGGKPSCDQGVVNAAILAAIERVKPLQAKRGDVISRVIDERHHASDSQTGRGWTDHSIAVAGTSAARRRGGFGLDQHNAANRIEPLAHRHVEPGVIRDPASQ